MNEKAVPIAKTRVRVDDVDARMSKTRVVIPKMGARLRSTDHPMPKRHPRIALGGVNGLRVERGVMSAERGDELGPVAAQLAEGL